MKYSIIVSPLVPVVMTILLIYQLYLVPLLIAGGISACWVWSFIFIQKEKNLLKEGIQYLMDSSGNIRIPTTSIHTPLKTIYNNYCPENAKTELLLAIRKTDCLNEYLTELTNLKRLFTHSGSVDIAEYEFGKFIRNKVDSLREHVINNQIKLEIKTEFKYASIWFGQSKVPLIIGKFIRDAIDHVRQKQTVILAISINLQHWQVKIAGYKSRRLIRCYTHKKFQLFKRGEELEHSFDKSIFYEKLLRLCNGEILINHSQ